MPRKARRRNSKPGSIRKMIKSQLDKAIESKRYSYSYAGSSIGTASGALTNKVLSNIVSGTASSQRIGHVINTTGFYAQFVVKVNTSAALATQVVRLVLVAPHDDASSLAVDLTGVSSVIDPDRYVVLYDRMITLTKNTDSSTQRIVIKRKFKRKVRYDASTGAAVRNGLYLYLVSDDNTNKPTLDGHWIIHYKDG